MPNCLRVLIVEDSEDDALLMVNELECTGYKVAYKRVQTAEETGHALARDTWDLVLADFKMPRFSGNAALKLVKDHGLDMPFILVSGKIGEETAVEAMKAGAHDYVMKDNLTRLVPAVQRELREAQNRRERKRADEALHESEFRFRQIFENAPVMMHSIDRDGVIRHVNSKWLKEIGYEQEEVIGREIDFLMTPESGHRMWEVLARFWAERKVTDLFYQYIRKNGTIMDVLLDSVVVDDPIWGEISLSVVRDVTAQRCAENALRESEERYRTLIETMNEGFGIQDVNGIITYANQKLCEMLQCSQEELIGRSANDFFDAFDQTVDHLPKMLNDTSYEVTWTGKNGSSVATIMSPRPLFDFQGEFVGSCAVITDISERKRKEEEVARLRHQLELILSSAWEGIFGLDAEGNHTFVNPAA
ncbi:MAG: PAS domain S-box protein, partial [Desulfomonilaceae bacterium]